jgi:hypothetical protein
MKAKPPDLPPELPVGSKYSAERSLQRATGIETRFVTRRAPIAQSLTLGKPLRRAVGGTPFNSI